MLTISKSTLFNSDGLAARGQCSHDAPGWQLRWFDRNTPPVTVWQGAFKTCRRLQAGCVSAGSIEEAKSMIIQLLNAESFTNIAKQPTDAYPAAGRDDYEPDGAPEPAGAIFRKKRKRKKY
ncbi:MAG: hypothetical protein FWG74_01995 [Planctomycetes bacterium]|nr:hypothetical protein [Planctomycetota bacterium]